MVLAELRQLAGELNIPDTAGMRKGDLIAAIKERQGGASAREAGRRRQLSLPDNSVPAAATRTLPTAADAASTNGAARPRPPRPPPRPPPSHGVRPLERPTRHHHRPHR